MKKTASSFDQSEEINQDDPVILRRILGIIPSISFILGLIIGTGIFLTPAGVLRGSSGSIGISFIVWILGAFVAATSAMCLTELALYFRQSGGVFVFLNEGYGPAVGFIRAWLSLFVTYPCSAAIQSIVIVNFLLTPVVGSCNTVPNIGIKFGATAVFMLIVYINSISTNWTSRTQVLLTIIKVGAVFLIIIMGAVTMIVHGKGNLRPPFEMTGEFQWSKLPSAFYSATFAYDGWNNIVNITEEVKKPEKNIVRAMVISLTCITILYLLVNLAYLVVLTPEEIIASDAVAALFAVRVVGVRWSFIIWLCVVLSSCGLLNGTTYVCSRIYFVAARSRRFPFIMSTIHINKKTPIASLVTMVPFTIIAIWSGDIWSIINFLTCLGAALSVLTLFAVPYLRWKLPERNLSYKAPIWCCFFPIIFNVTLIVTTAYTNPVQVGVGAGMICASLLSYFLFEITSKSPRAMALIRPWYVFLQKLLLSVQQELDTY